METRSRKTVKALSSTDFRLVDFRIKKLSAERFTDEIEESAGGATRTRTTADSMLPAKSSPASVGVLDLTIALEGFQGEGRADEDRSFCITATVELIFLASGDGYVRDADAPDFVHLAVMQAFPLVVTKLRQIAHEMGFTGADPDLGLQPTVFPTKKEPTAARRKLTAK